jgi:antitoxin component YwqK of YwqJK toxin-antitoxin module
MSQSNYCYGDLCGEKVEYNPNGTLRLRENYLNDELHGKAEYFNTEGKKVNAYQYYCGYLISVIL